MYPGEIIFGLYAYELFLIIGMLIAIFLADRMAIKAGFSLSLQRQLLLSVIVALVFGVFGAALFQGFYHFFNIANSFSFNGRYSPLARLSSSSIPDMETLFRYKTFAPVYLIIRFTWCFFPSVIVI